MAYKRELIAKTKNLFNLATASVGYIDWQGNLNHSEDTITYGLSSDYLECTPNTSYTISAFCGKHPLTNDSTLWCRIAYYDENKQLLTSPSKFFTDTNIDYISATWSAPTNAKYLRATTRWMSPTYREQHPENWVMLEKNSTATDYVPYGHLSSYKKLLKVSDVCQLHSPKYFISNSDFYNVSFESTDGKTWVVNGTSNYTGVGRAFFQISKDSIELIKRHRYLIRGATKNWNDGTAVEIDNNSTGIIDGKIFEQSTTKRALLYIAITRNLYTDAIFKPQLFDLTEMYGAGNEPKTVEEFRAKFPNELYDYSPRCWVKSYKTGLIAKTKNLFNINALTPYTPETLPGATAGRYNGNIITRCNVGTSVARSNKLLKELCPNMVAGERYILHFDTNGTGRQANTIYLNGTDAVWVNGYTHVVTEAELNETVFFYGNYPSLDVATISNFQIEKGTTATDYVPYGYL